MAEEKQDQYFDDEINLAEVFSVLWKRKLWIAALIVAAMVFSYGWAVSHGKSYTRSLVQLNFSGIDKHTYPDGTPFEMHDLISTDILDVAANAIEDTEHRELFLSNPRGFITVDPRIPIEVKEKISAMEREKQTYDYLPNQFYISFVQPKDGIFTHEEKKQVLLAINEAFKDKFMQDYVQKELLSLDLTPEKLNQYDYLESLDIVSSYLDTYKTFLRDMIESTGLYRSPSTGRSFVDILSSLENIRKTDLYELQSILKVSLETKQEDVLVKKYQYRIKSLEKEMQKKEEEAKVAKDLLKDVWAQGKGKGVLDGSSDSQSSSQVILDAEFLEKLSEKDYTSVLLQKALEAEITANSLRIDKKYLENELAMLTGNAGKKANPRFSSDVIEGMLEDIRKNIMALGKNANDLSIEFLSSRYADIIKVLNYPESFVQYPRNPKTVTAMALVISLMVGIVIAFIAEYASNTRKKM